MPGATFALRRDTYRHRDGDVRTAWIEVPADHPHSLGMMFVRGARRVEVDRAGETITYTRAGDHPHQQRSAP